MVVLSHIQQFYENKYCRDLPSPSVCMSDSEVDCKVSGTYLQHSTSLHDNPQVICDVDAVSDDFVKAFVTHILCLYTQ
jgi:hypothetical protein